MRRGALIFLIVPFLGLAAAIALWSGDPVGGAASRGGGDARAGPGDPAFDPARADGPPRRIFHVKPTDGSAPKAPARPAPAASPAAERASELPPGPEADAEVARARATLDSIFKGDIGLELEQQQDREARVAEALARIPPKDFVKIVARYRSTPAAVAIDHALSVRLEPLDPPARAAWEEHLVTQMAANAQLPQQAERLASVATWAVLDLARREQAAARLEGIAAKWDDAYWKRRALELAAQLRRPPE